MHKQNRAIERIEELLNKCTTIYEVNNVTEALDSEIIVNQLDKSIRELLFSKAEQRIKEIEGE